MEEPETYVIMGYLVRSSNLEVCRSSWPYVPLSPLVPLKTHNPLIFHASAPPRLSRLSLTPTPPTSVDTLTSHIQCPPCGHKSQYRGIKLDASTRKLQQLPLPWLPRVDNSLFVFNCKTQLPSGFQHAVLQIWLPAVGLEEGSPPMVVIPVSGAVICDLLC